ncbi:MAG: hypothetical protein HYT80_08555 [Euryarchaeota archaeon]|nr:hypothetical protein [Euryarchaeota archaeon]
MDIKSIVRVFRFGELQSKADRDPAARRPPTIMFLGLAAALGLAVAGVAIVLADANPSAGDGGKVLEVSDPTPTTTTTSETPPGTTPLSPIPAEPT